MSDFDKAALRERNPIEQGARDSLQLAINALIRARDAKAHFELCDNLDGALREIATSMTLQKIVPLDFEGFGTTPRELTKLMTDWPGVTT